MFDLNVISSKVRHTFCVQANDIHRLHEHRQAFQVVFTVV